MPLSTFGKSENENIMLYPNPADDEFMVFLGPNTKTLIRLYDLNGKLIYFKDTSQNSEVINSSRLSNGIYFLHINGENNAVKKIIIKH